MYKDKLMFEDEILLEKKLTTDFTMGFELEAVWLDEYSRDMEGMEDEIYSFFNKYFPGGDLHEDGSLNDYGEGAAFEWSSPVLSVNIATINKILTMFKDGLEKYFTANDSCGFHHHISFPGITAEDMIWIMCKLATDENMVRKISKFKDLDFVTHWSKSSYLTDLKNAVEANDFSRIVKLCSTDKYSLVNVHGHHTLEWRGPRGILTHDDPLTTLRDFYKLFWSFVKWMTDVLDENEINDMSKDNFMAGIKTAFKGTGWGTINGFQFTKEKNKNGVLSDDNLKGLFDRTKRDNKFIAKIYKQPFFEQFVQWLYNNNRLGKRVDEVNSTDTNPEILKKINNIFYKYVPYRMLKKYFETLSTDTIKNTSELTMKRLCNTSRLDGLSVSSSNKAQIINDYFEYFNPNIITIKNLEGLFVENFFVYRFDKLFTYFVQSGLLKETSDNFLISNGNQLIVDVSNKCNDDDYNLEAEELKLKIILKTALEAGKTGVIKAISRKLFDFTMSMPEFTLKFLKPNKNQLIWLLSKVKNDTSTSNYEKVCNTLISLGKATEEEILNIENFIKRDHDVSTEDDLVYDEDNIDFSKKTFNPNEADDE